MSDLLRPPNFGKRHDESNPPPDPPKDDSAAQDARLRKAMLAVGVGAVTALVLAVVYVGPQNLGSGAGALGTAHNLLVVVGIVVLVTVMAPRARRGTRDRKLIVGGSLMLLLAVLILGIFLYLGAMSFNPRAVPPPRAGQGTAP